MHILVVGNVLKDVYLNLDSRTEHLEADKHGVKWLDLGFNASKHHFFSRNCSFGGAAISLEVLEKMGLSTSVSGSDLKFINNSLSLDSSIEPHRYILVANDDTSYFVPTSYPETDFTPPAEAVDYLYIDRSANLTITAIKKIQAYLELSTNTKLIIYYHRTAESPLNHLLPRADLLIIENNRDNTEDFYAPELQNIPPEKIIYLSEQEFSYLNIHESFSASRLDKMTHLSTFSIAAATILGGFILGLSVEDSLKMARINLENSKLNETLSFNQLQELLAQPAPDNNLELLAANLVLSPKGILAADESGGSIKKKFEQLNIPDTYDTRHTYRDILLSAPDLNQYVNGVILFDETARQSAANGQNYVEYLTSKRIIPGIKVDQGLEKFENSLETYTKGLDGLDQRLKEYYAMGLRFAKWRAAFELRLNEAGDIITPTDHAIKENCHILAEYALKCQNAGIVPIVEPEIVYDGYYSISDNAKATGLILDTLFQDLSSLGVNLRACILKVNMIIAGKHYPEQSTPEEVGAATAEVLKAHVPSTLAGVVFLSGGQTPEQATDNLAAVIKNGPFPWPVTFSFARALQDPALFTWAGNDSNIKEARQAFLDRFLANSKALMN